MASELLYIMYKNANDLARGRLGMGSATARGICELSSPQVGQSMSCPVRELSSSY